jgi:hypothetical protein
MPCSSELASLLLSSLPTGACSEVKARLSMYPLAYPFRLCPPYISLTIVWAMTKAILAHGFRCVDRITSVSCAGRQGAAGLGAGRLQGAAKTERMMIAGRRPPIAGRLKNAYAAESSPRGRHGPARTRRAARVGPEGRRWGAWFGHE